MFHLVPFPNSRIWNQSTFGNDKSRTFDFQFVGSSNLVAFPFSSPVPICKLFQICSKSRLLEKNVSKLENLEKERNRNQKLEEKKKLKRDTRELLPVEGEFSDHLK